MIDDPELLRRYCDENSQEAFAELVQRHLGLVYHAALRQAGGDPHRAQDIAQTVFTDLARKARKLADRPVLTGWLYTSVRYAASQVMRSERRRQAREQQVYVMNELLGDDSAAADWDRMRPVIDDILLALDERDREALLLRFFAGHSFAALAEKLGSTEDAARMRVSRAMQKMRDLLARRGVTSTTAALGLALATQTGAAAPIGVASAITAAALSGAATAAATGVSTGIFFMSTTKLVSGIATVVAVIAVGTAIYQAKTSARTEEALAEANTAREHLNARLSSAEKRMRESEEALAGAQKALSDLRDKPVEAPPRQATSNVGPLMAYVLEHPETHDAHIQQQMLRAKRSYGHFFRSAGLSAEQEEQALAALQEAVEGEFDVMGALHAKGFGVGNLPKDPAERMELHKILKEKKEGAWVKLRAVLGDDLLRQFQQYGEKIPERNVADQIASRLYATDAPLTREQAEQVVEVLAQNRFTAHREPSAANTIAGTFINPRAYNGRMGQAMQLGGMNLFEWKAPLTDAAIAHAEKVLTPTQLSVLREVQAQQLTEFQLAPPPPSPTPSAGK